jgi:membrane-bound acyltransferase YfiQ involved in biofilm formation
VDQLIALNPSSSFVRWLIFFVLGIVTMYNLKPIKQWLARYRWWLLGATLILAALTFFESEWVYQHADLEWWRSSPLTLPASLYTISLVFCFLAFGRSHSAVSDLFVQFGKASLAIYLIHYMVLEFAARVIQKYLPALLAQTELFYVVIVALGLGLPLLLMKIVSRTGLRKYHRYLFG